MYSVERDISRTDRVEVLGGAASLELTDSFDADHSYENSALGSSWDYTPMSGDDPAATSAAPPPRFEAGDPPGGRASFEVFLPPPQPQPNGDVAAAAIPSGARPKLVLNDNVATKNGRTVVPSPPSPKSAGTKLVKTSSTPATMSDENPRAAVPGDDYVAASPPPSAAVSHRSGSGLGARVSDPMSPPTPASDAVGSSGSQSPAVVSSVAGVSLSSRSRVFTRQK